MAATGIGSSFRALSRLLLYLAMTAPLMVVQTVAVATRSPLHKRLPLWYHKQCCRILGFRIERAGSQSAAHPTLYVANHASYFDIMVLGSIIPGSFVAKAEVARWPFFGWLAKLQRTIFVDRLGRKSVDQRDEMAERLRAGDDLILFPEGTSSDGNRVLPFKSSLFSVAEAEHSRSIPVQPVSVAYTRLDGVPLGRYLRPLIAWYGDMDLATHLWHAAGLGWVTAVVEFHPPTTVEELGSRKALSEYCQRQIAAGVTSALSGRERVSAEPRRLAATG